MAKSNGAQPRNGDSKKRPATLADLSEDDLSDDSGTDSSQMSGSGAESGPDGEFAGFSDEEEADQDQDLKTGGGNAGQSGPAHRKVKGEDVRIARETSDLYKSNIFKLQIDELFEQIKLDEKYVAEANKVLFRLKELLTNSESLKDQSVKTVHSAIPNVIPFPEPGPAIDSPIKFRYDAPESVNVIGSYALQTIVRQPEGSGIDLLVKMPSALFEKKDYLNYRYFHKRAFYVACVANIIANNSPLKLKTSYVYLDNDVLRPYLLVEFTEKKLAKRLHIIIRFGIDSDVFPVRKLGPDRNAVRTVSVATPEYNRSLLSDIAHEDVLRLLITAKTRIPAFVDACKLGRLWLRKRGFSSAALRGGFGHFEFAAVMAALSGGGPSGKPVLLQGYSSYQLFRATLLYIASSEIQLTVSSSRNGRTTALGEPGIWLEDFPLDLLGKMPQWSRALLRHEAAVCSDLLSDVTRDRFSDIFIKPTDTPALRFDHTFTLELPLVKSYSSEVWPNYKLFASETVYTTLTQAFGGRVTAMAILDASEDDDEHSWALSSLPPPLSQDVPQSFVVGLLVDPELSEKRVTFGPEPTEPEEAKLFKAFWGSRSSLRRFQDGNIREAVVWKQGILPIVLDIANYALSSRLSASVLVPNLVERVLPPLRHHKDRAISSISAFQAKIAVFQECARMLQELRDLPLRITSVYSTSSSLRYASIQEPSSNDFSGDDSIATGIIQLESSSRWPDDIQAIEKTKTAFLLGISEAIQKTAQDYTTVVGVEPSALHPEIEAGFLMIQSSAGFVFKLTIRTNKDTNLLRRQFEFQNPDEKLLASKRIATAAADHNRLIGTMSLRFPLYSATARVLKLWFRKHLIGSMVTEQMIELLALQPFLDSAPYTPPNSVSSGFYRIMSFLATWNWKDTPLIYDVSRSQDDESNTLTSVQGTQMSPHSFQSLYESFKKHRQRDPAMTLSPYFIGTAVDLDGTSWTQHLPRSKTGLIIAGRITALARGVVGLIRDNNVDAMFKPALADYDFEIRLDNPSVSDRKTFRNLGADTNEIISGSQNIGLEFFKDMQNAFRSTAILFYSGSMDDRSSRKQVITGIWNPEAFTPQPFRVNLPFNSMPAGSGDQVKGNKAAVLTEILRLGDDMVKLVRS